MAETKRKTTKKTARKTPAKKNNGKRPIRREVAGVIMLLLALCVGIGYFTEENAVGIRYLALGIKGLLGYGYWLSLPCLLVAAWILLLHRGRKVTFPLISAFSVPVFVSSLWHAAFCKEEYASSLHALKDLWLGGTELRAGGVLGGGLAIGLMAVVGQIAGIIIFTVLVIAFAMAALRLSPSAIREKMRERERLAYEEEEEMERLRAAAEKSEKESTRSAVKPVTAGEYRIDIPLDDEPKKPGKKAALLGGLFASKPDHVRTPDELLNGEKTAAVPEKVSAPAPASAVPPMPLTEETETKKRKSSLGKKEAAEESERVAAEVEENKRNELEDYEYPPISLLDLPQGSGADGAEAEMGNNARRLAETLYSFGVDAVAGDVVRGPSVTRYEFMLEQGVKLSKVTNLADDIALALGASGVRIAPIPDKISVVGVEVPNKTVSVVPIREIIESRAFTEHKSSVAFAVGKDIGGHQIVGDIAKLPHILIAGTTGSGKSVCTNSLIISLLYKSSPADVKFIMVDPKMVELAPYNGIPHLLIPVVTDPKKAAGALQWAVYEMMKRYKIFSENGVKDLKGYNELAAKDGTKEHLPSVVVVIDELADLMLIAAKEVEESICREAQMGRAAGVHLVIATQRPSADVITGLMKANIPSRIAFAVASSLESRIILDNSGAEKLVGRGDMLYAPLGEGKPHRVQGCFISAEEIEKVVSFVKKGGEAQYDDSVMQHIDRAVAESEKSGKAAANDVAEESDEADELLPAAVDVIFETGQASVSMLQRRLKLGYSRAARLVDQMEERGIVGPFEGSKPRQVLITRARWQEMQMAGETVAGESFAEANAPSEEDFSQLPIDEQ